MKIGHLAQVAQTTAPTIRYYEEIGLLPRPLRQAGSQRVYGEEDVGRLSFIRRCRDFGFSIDRVRLLVSLMQHGDRPCSEVRDIASGHLAEIRGKLAELHELERSMAAFVDSCDRTCPGGPGPDCVILGELKIKPAPVISCCSRAAE